MKKPHIIMLLIALIYIASVIYAYVNTHYINTEEYMLQSAPWYLGAEINFVVVAILEFILYISTKSKKKENK